ncbi:hypothetical protein Pmani_013990 [Petrolisthes manimaculis]|uniref:Thyroid transcription factor 1-associated protein 26 n=1 Tax=Petrolisthes manimaculis TaxID=1843537 RepID=A0AAE1PXA9_9EUCA|nr:hypothetical protein Pmani_013990 [Petrolisthes manimaculis]
MSPPQLSNKKGNIHKNKKNTFNKREYYNQKLKSTYGTQNAGHGLDDHQKKKIMRQFERLKKKELKKEATQMTEGGVDNVEAGMDSTLTSEEQSPFTQPVQKKKKGSMQRARASYHLQIEKKKEKEEHYQNKKREIEEANKIYKEKRLQRFKKLSKKTNKGQPVMSGRIELMLEQLESEMKE